MAEGETRTFVREHPVDWAVDKSLLETIVLIQDDTTLEVLQAAGSF